MRHLLFIMVVTFGLTSCATNPALDQFPSRRIDRTPTNSGKVTAWSTIAIGTATRSTNGEVSFTSPIPWPLYFDDPAASNAVNVLDSGFFAVDFPFGSEDGSFMVASFGWTPNTAAGYGFNNQYSFGLTKRQMFDRNTALDYGVIFTSLVFDAGFNIQSYHPTFSLEFQATDNLWLKPVISAEIQNVPQFSIVAGNFIYTLTKGVYFEYPVGVEMSLNLSRGWELRGGYRIYMLGRNNDSWEQRYFVGLTANY